MRVVRTREESEMLVGTTIIHSDTGTDSYYTPSFPRGGLSANFSLDVTHIAAAASLTLVVAVEHKNEDETSWAVAGTFSNITAKGVATKDITGLKEEVRMSFTYSAGAEGDFVHLVLTQPAWRPY